MNSVKSAYCKVGSSNNSGLRRGVRMPNVVPLFCSIRDDISNVAIQLPVVGAVFPVN